MDSQFKTHRYRYKVINHSMVSPFLDIQPMRPFVPTRTVVFSGMFKGRLNLDYRASNDPNTEHRALYIKSPDPEMSGEYTCSVSSLASEDLKTKRMLVFGKP